MQVINDHEIKQAEIVCVTLINIKIEFIYKKIITYYELIKI